MQGTTIIEDIRDPSKKKNEQITEGDISRGNLFAPLNGLVMNPTDRPKPIKMFIIGAANMAVNAIWGETFATTTFAARSPSEFPMANTVNPKTASEISNNLPKVVKISTNSLAIR